LFNRCKCSISASKYRISKFSKIISLIHFSSVGVFFCLNKDLSKKWQAMKQMIPEREARLNAELTRQQRNEQLRKQFALKANMVGQWIERHLDINASIFAQKGTTPQKLICRQCLTSMSNVRLLASIII